MAGGGGCEGRKKSWEAVRGVGREGEGVGMGKGEGLECAREGRLARVRREQRRRR